MSAPMNSVFVRILPSIRPKSLFCHHISRCFSVCPLLMKKSKIEKLNRLLEKKKKKFYFDVHNPTQFGKVANKFITSRKLGRMRPADTLRLRCLNDNLFQHICDFINSDLISEELQKLNILLLGVRLSGDLGTCRVFWQASGDVVSDDKVQEVLDRYAFTIRHRLASLRILSKTPLVMFMRDKASANIAEVDRLLAEADMGPSDSEDEGTDQIPSVADMSPIHVHSQRSLNFLNMDLGRIDQEIEKYKKKSGSINALEDDSTKLEAIRDLDISKSFAQFKVLQRKKKKVKDRKTSPIAASFTETEEDLADGTSFEDEAGYIEDDDTDDWLHHLPEDDFNR